MKFSDLLELDARISHRLRLDIKAGFWLKIAAFFAHSGDSWFWVAGLGLLWIFGVPDWRSRAALMGISVVVLAVLVLTIKFTVRRSRPIGDWGAIYRNTDPHSFPSGHAARAFMLVVLAFGLGPAWFGWILLVWAPLVSLARVSTGVHFPSDILAGMLLGLGWGWIMLQLQPTLLHLFPFLF